MLTSKDGQCTQCLASMMLGCTEATKEDQQ